MSGGHPHGAQPLCGSASSGGLGGLDRAQLGKDRLHDVAANAAILAPGFEILGSPFLAGLCGDQRALNAVDPGFLKGLQLSSGLVSPLAHLGDALACLLPGLDYRLSCFLDAALDPIQSLFGVVLRDNADYGLGSFLRHRSAHKKGPPKASQKRNRPPEAVLLI